MPNRILKESICSSDNLDKLTAFQETVFYRLIVNCDDYGRMDARPKILAAKLFPLKEIRSSQMEDALRALTSAELVNTYYVDGKPFLQMKTWEQHQTVRAKRSKYPSPQADESTCMQMHADACKCSRNPIQSESNPNPNPNTNNAPDGGEHKKSVRFSPPSPDEVNAYCRGNGYQVDGQAFCDFYASKGWKVGNQPMKDWQAAVRTWARHDAKPSAQRPVKTVTAQQYQQRNYTEEELLVVGDDLIKEARQRMVAK